MWEPKNVCTVGTVCTQANVTNMEMLGVNAAQLHCIILQREMLLQWIVTQLSFQWDGNGWRRDTSSSHYWFTWTANRLINVLSNNTVCIRHSSSHPQINFLFFCCQFCATQINYSPCNVTVMNVAQYTSPLIGLHNTWGIINKNNRCH